MTIIDDLLNRIDNPVYRTELERMRKVINQTCPDAEEVMTYGMPGFKYKGKYLISFGAFKDHMSIFPGSEAIELLEDELKPYAISKGTIQFTPETPISNKLLAKIVNLCMGRIG